MTMVKELHTLGRTRHWQNCHHAEHDIVCSYGIFSSTYKINSLMFDISYLPFISKKTFYRIKAEGQSKYFWPPGREMEN